MTRDVIQPFVAFNFGPQPVYPRVTFPVAEPDDIQALTTVPRRHRQRPESERSSATLSRSIGHLRIIRLGARMEVTVPRVRTPEAEAVQATSGYQLCEDVLHRRTPFSDVAPDMSRPDMRQAHAFVLYRRSRITRVHQRAFSGR